MTSKLSKKFVRLGSHTICQSLKKSINQSDKSASTIGTNACKSVEILMGNILKNNNAIFDD